MLHEPRSADQGARTRPIAKELRATLQGKQAAISKLVQRALLREGAHIRGRVTLTDGAEALQGQMSAQLPTYTLVLDIIHASEYLWDSATALLGETQAGRSAWVHGAGIRRSAGDRTLAPGC